MTHWALTAHLQTPTPATLHTQGDMGHFQVFVLVGTAPGLPEKQKFDIYKGENDFNHGLYFCQEHTQCVCFIKK